MRARAAAALRTMWRSGGEGRDVRARAAAPLRLFARCGDEEGGSEMSVLTQSPPRPADAALGTVRGQDTLPRLFRQVVRERGERVAMREKHLGIWRAITWREYEERVPHVALALVAVDLRPRDYDTIQADNRTESQNTERGTLCT